MNKALVANAMQQNAALTSLQKLINQADAANKQILEKQRKELERQQKYKYYKYFVFLNGQLTERIEKIKDSVVQQYFYKPLKLKTMANIYHNFVVKAPVTKVYEVISQLDGLKKWWTTDTTGNSEKGGELRFGFGGGMFNKMKVTGKEKNKLVTWKCIEGPEDWIGTNLSFTLSEDKDKNTIVKFEHNGWKAANDFYGSCNFHWGRYMISMKSLCETDKGTPHTV